LIRSFEENWNGYGAKSIDGILLDKAEWICRYLKEDLKIYCNIFPTQSSNLQLEFSKDGVSYELEMRLTKPDTEDTVKQ